MSNNDEIFATIRAVIKKEMECYHDLMTTSAKQPHLYAALQLDHILYLHDPNYSYLERPI